MKTFFYIIQRNEMIHEIENIGNRFVSSLEQWQKGGLIIFPTLGTGINTVDISNILNGEQYDNFIDSTHPKLYIKQGVWRDGKERRVVRYEPWKLAELKAAEEKQLMEPKVPREELKGLFAKYRPEFMKNSKI